jgi:hypothetical protein
MNIPTIIKQQLFSNDRMKVWSWGAHDWFALSYNTLCFKVNAHHFKGVISIALDEGQDLYDIHFFDNYRKSSFIKTPKPSQQIQPMTGIFCDQMVELIDDHIERIAAYHQ